MRSLLSAEPEAEGACRVLTAFEHTAANSVKERNISDYAEGKSYAL